MIRWYHSGKFSARVGDMAFLFDFSMVSSSKEIPGTGIGPFTSSSEQLQ
jgi:hypothetical protein